MKHLFYIVLFCGFLNLQAQTTVEDFIGKKFTLSHYLINNDDTREEITDTEIENGNIAVESYNGHDASIATTNSTLYISGYFECSIYSNIYNFNTNNTFTPFKLVEGATLGGVGCGRATFFPVLLGFESDNPKILNFDFTDEDHLILWSNVNRKFVFTSETNTDNSNQPSSTASVKNSELANSIKLIPSPAANTITFQGIEKLQIDEICIYDASGKKVLRTNQLAHKSIDISYLQTGLYVVIITSDRGTIIKKILKN